VKVGDLVRYRERSGSRDPNNTDMKTGVVVGFDSEQDPIVFFTCRYEASAYYKYDIEVLNESR